jgi:hypothetical protein
MAKSCENCGEKVYDGYCTWCCEEYFIAEQYAMSEETIPVLLLDKIEEYQPQRRRNLEYKERKGIINEN